MAQAETEAYNVKNVQSLRTKQLNVMKEEKEGNGDGEGEGEGNLALNSWHVRVATPTQGPRGKQFGKPTRTSHSLTHTRRHTHMCRLQLAPGLGAINVTGPAISLKCLAYVCYLMLIFILFPLELLMLAVVSISAPCTQGYLARRRRLDKPGRQLNADN